MMTLLERKRAFRPTALLVAASLAFPVCFVGCGGKGGGGGNANIPPPVDDSRGRMATSRASHANAARQKRHVHG